MYIKIEYSFFDGRKTPSTIIIEDFDPKNKKQVEELERVLEEVKLIYSTDLKSHKNLHDEKV